MNIKRIQKEYLNLIKDPISNIKTLPNPDNILEWHYVIIGNQEPYLNGEYYGILTLHEDYPFKAPRIIIKTPNGRFKPDTRLCFSMSDYHQETWNPNWNIRTILIGFYSFMLEESITEGSIKCDNNTRKLYAQNSIIFNNTLDCYKNLFLNTPINITTELTNDQPICKFCYESTGELLSVCDCKGSNQYIHKSCLNTWQLKTILNQSTHPDYQVDSDLICSVCKSKYKIKGQSREEIMNNLTGTTIINQIKLGYVFISSETSSKSNLELVSIHNNIELEENILHWTYGVFLIVENTNGIIAINTNRNIKKSKFYEKYITLYNNYLNTYNLNNISNVNSIFIGGPCEINTIFGLIYLKDLNSFNVNLKNVKIINETNNNYLIFGLYHYIYKLYQIKPENILNLHIYLGYAGWSNVQLISEFAKTNWGITNISVDILFENNNYDLINQKNCLFVKKNIYSENK